MSIKNLRGECQRCGQPIEFRAEFAGTTAECPHCGQPTELLLAVPETEESPLRTKAIVFTVVAVVILLAGLAGALLALKRAQRLSPRPSVPVTSVTPTNPPGPADAFARQGFNISPVSLEKNSSGSIVHAVGEVRNATNRQRYGVRVELQLLDNAGNVIGTATDYQAVLEPNAEWPFRALVVDKRVTQVKVVAIRETP